MKTTQADFRKVCRVGRLRLGRGRPGDLFIKIEFKDGRLSFFGVIGPNRHGNASGGCGQIDMEFAHRNPAHNDSRSTHLTQPEEIDFAPGWDRERWLDLLDAWDRWHRNDMRAGTPAQEAYLRANPVHVVYPESHCEKASAALAAVGLNPDGGYRYGSEWKREEVPTDVLDFILALPDADKVPVWC